MILQLALTLGLVQLVQLQTVCVPDQFKVQIGFQTGYTKGDQRGSVQGFEEVWYDASGERVAVYENITTNGVTLVAWVLQDYKNQKQYVVINKECHIASLGSFQQGCIPDSAQKYGPAYMGLLGKGLSVTYHLYQEANITVSATFTTHAPYIPVGAVLSGNQNGADFMMVTGYSNFVLGIKDPKVFNVPEVCKRGKVMNGNQRMDVFGRGKSAFFP